MIGGLSHLRSSGGLVPALPSSVLEPLWDQIAALLPARQDTHPLGCHRPRIPDRIVFDKLIQVLVFGCGYRKIADATMSGSPWLGLAEQLRLLVLAAYDRLLGLDSAWNWSTWRWMGAPPRRPAAARLPGPAQWTAASRDSSARWSPTHAASRWGRCPPRPTTGTTGCWLPPWTPSAWSGCCPSGRWCTWTPAMTTGRVRRSWPFGAWWVKSLLVGCQPRFRLAAAG